MKKTKVLIKEKLFEILEAEIYEASNKNNFFSKKKEFIFTHLPPLGYYKINLKKITPKAYLIYDPEEAQEGLKLKYYQVKTLLERKFSENVKNEKNKFFEFLPQNKILHVILKTEKVKIKDVFPLEEIKEIKQNII